MDGEREAKTTFLQQPRVNRLRENKHTGESVSESSRLGLGMGFLLGRKTKGRYEQSEEVERREV